MAILITGSSGFVGSNLARRLSERELVLLGRNNSGSCNCYDINMGPISDYSEVLDGVETIVHCVAKVHSNKGAQSIVNDEYKRLNVEVTINLANQAINAGVKRFIFLSSIKAIGEQTRLGSPFDVSSRCYPEDIYGETKLEAEKQLINLAKTSDLEVVIIRPTLVYGPGVKANFASLMNAVNNHFPLPFALLGNNYRSLVSVENLVDLIVTCIDHPKARNQIFLVSDDEDISTNEMAKKIAKSLGVPYLRFPVPKWIFKLLGRIFRKQDVVDRLLGSLQVDITHTKTTLDWRPPQSMEDGFKQTAQDLISSKEQIND